MSEEMLDEVCRIDMLKYGITTIVETKRSRINWYLNEFATQPDVKFGSGAGKEALLSYLYETILAEDNFFNQCASNQRTYEKRWFEHSEDCVIVACLHSYLSGCDLAILDAKVSKTMDKVMSVLGQPGVINQIDFNDSHLIH